MTKHIDTVVAAVPNYNMSEYVLALLPQLLEQGYDKVYVLDDKSRDDSVEKIHSTFGDTVEVVAGDTNLGAAGNRNRIIQALHESSLDGEVIINFVDADTELLPSTTPFSEVARQLFDKYPEAGMIAGLVQNVDGTNGAFNFGPAGLLEWLRTAPTQLKLEPLSKTDLEKAKQLYERHKDKMKEWPNIFDEPVARTVGHVVECFTFTKLSTFEELGGYDEKLRYCEAIEFGLRLRQHGVASIFDPSVGIRHLQVDNRGWHRYVEVLHALSRISARNLIGQYKTK
jgi:N-acetylglucosaminyl-diphospho-decaprenol L-rhamnosyltransferase